MGMGGYRLDGRDTVTEDGSAGGEQEGKEEGGEGMERDSLCGARQPRACVLSGAGEMGEECAGRPIEDRRAGTVGVSPDDSEGQEGSVADTVESVAGGRKPLLQDFIRDRLSNGMFQN